MIQGSVQNQQQVQEELWMLQQGDLNMQNQLKASKVELMLLEQMVEQEEGIAAIETLHRGAEHN